MGGWVDRFRNAADGQGDDVAAALKAAMAARGCSSCGRTFANAAAYAIHREHGQCLSDTAHGQLVSVDGVWDEAWRHPEAR